jgi:hypothetical protein
MTGALLKLLEIPPSLLRSGLILYADSPGDEGFECFTEST